jgi:enoyl-CoA hydratase/carnithine racemase
MGGARLSIAFACDMLVAARNVSFPASYVKVGLPPDGRATTRLSEFVPWRVLTEPGLKSEHVADESMHALGVVNHLAEPCDALIEAISMAVLLASGPRRVSARIKTLCRDCGENTLVTHLELEARHVMKSVAFRRYSASQNVHAKRNLS